MLWSKRLVAEVCVGVGLCTGIVLAGDLTPPAGPVTGTFKTLTAVEPRIAVNAVNTPGDASSIFVINQPGSYYLEGNVFGVAGKSGIQIASNNVTLDLNGYTLYGGFGTLDGVSVFAFRRNVVIRNGLLFDWNQHGVFAQMASGLIENLVVLNSGGWGVYCDNFAYAAQISNCQTVFNGLKVGATGGIYADSAVVESCVSTYNSGAGIQVMNRSVVRNNRCDENGDNAGVGSLGRGIYVTGDGNRIEDNAVTKSPIGVEATGSGTLLVGNSVRNSATPFVMAAGNHVHVIAAPPSGAFSGGSGGTQVSTDPFANFSY